jgi:hypothetical protein
VDVHAEDLEAAGHPLHLLHQSVVAGVGADRLIAPVRERVGARAQQGQAPGLGGPLHLGQGGFQVGPGLAHGLAHPGDDLHRALEQLVLGLGVHAAGVAGAQLGQQIRGGIGQLAGGGVDHLQLDLDAQAGAR